MSLTFDPSLAIFDAQQIDSSVESKTFVEIKTLTKVDSSGPFTFRVEPSPNFMDLENVLLKVRCKITRGNGDAIVADEKIGPINNVIHSLFSKVETKLRDTTVSHSNSLYPYRSYFEDLLMTDSEELDSRLLMQGFVLDKGGMFSIVDPAADIRNTGLTTRRNMFWKSEERILIGRLHCDIFRQKKYLLDRVPLRITLHRAPDSFCLMGAAVPGDDNNAAIPLDHKIIINDMSLMVPMVKISDAMRRSIEATLIQTPARYPVIRTVMQTHLVPLGTTSTTIPSMFTGNLPHTIIVGMVKNEDRRADYGKNPLTMEEFRINKMVVYRNNEALNYSNGLNLDFGLDGVKYTDAYLNCMANLNRMTKGLKFNMADFRSGYAFFPFRIAGQSDASINRSPLNHGVLDMEIGFSVQTPANLDIIVLAQYNGEFTVDNDRNVRTTESR